jgi:hypothetical protein
MPRQPPSPVPFRRKDFYDLTIFCRTYAMELARFDQDRVNLSECYRFNNWLAHLKTYDRLALALRDLKPARPVARWQIMVLLVVAWLITGLAMTGRMDRMWTAAILTGMAGIVVVNFFIPESLYGTTIELLQAKVLRIVDLLLEILNSGTMDFSEAVFFRARENLLAAHEELRQQIDLAHRG